MSLGRGSFRHGTVNGTGRKGIRTKHFNASIVASDLERLGTDVVQTANMTATELCAAANAVKMSFDENESIPSNVQGTNQSAGTTLVFFDKPVTSRAVAAALADEAAAELLSTATSLLKEAFE